MTFPKVASLRFKLYAGSMLFLIEFLLLILTESFICFIAVSRLPMKPSSGVKVFIAYDRGHCHIYLDTNQPVTVSWHPPGILLVSVSCISRGRKPTLLQIKFTSKKTQFPPFKPGGSGTVMWPLEMETLEFEPWFQR